MKTFAKSLLLCLVVMTLGCTMPAVSNDAADRPASSAPIQVTVTTDKAVYQEGETVIMMLTAKNTGTQPVTLTFPSGQRFDFIVSYQGRTLWKWSDGKAFPAVIGTITLQPGQAVSFRTNEYKALAGWNSIPGRIITLDLTGTLTSTPPYAGKTQFKVTRYAY